jgi:hypothetical protein
MPIMFRFFALCLIAAGCGDDDGMMMPPPQLPPGVPDETHGPSVDGDIDGDGVPDADDNCPSLANADQREACTYPPRPRAILEPGPDAAARITWYRSLVGLPAVTEDPAMTAGCAAHVDYLIALEAETMMPDVVNEQDLTKPYSSAEGDMAARGSQLSFGRADILAAVDASMNSPYARTTLLNPGLTRVGAAYMNGYGCIYTSAGLGAGSVAWPVYWPPPDIIGTQRVFEGMQVPCPTDSDPLGIEPMDCLPSAAIPTLGLYGMGDLSGVTGTITNLETSEAFPLFGTIFDGGPSEAEMMGYLTDSVAVVPMPMTELERALYEVRIDGTVGAAAQTYRWRFTTGRTFTDIGCDDHGIHRQISDALPIAAGTTIIGRICEFGDMFFLEGEGPRTVTVELSHLDGDLNVWAFDAEGMELARSTGPNDIEEIGVDAGAYVQIYGEAMGMGGYAITVQ